MTLDDLGDRLFADVPEVASILRRDPRTVRRAAAAGEIPAEKVGSKWMIKTKWLREQAGESTPGASPLDLDELADRTIDRLIARFPRFALMFGEIRSPLEGAASDVP